MCLPVDAQYASMKTLIEEMANRAVEFGNCMTNVSDERFQLKETILKTADEEGYFEEWRHAPGISTDMADSIYEEYGSGGFLMFTTVRLIKKHPKTEDYFREQSGIPKKRIGQQLKGLKGEERDSAWVEFVNSVCWRIIEKRKKWDQTYHEFLAASCRAVSLDGTMRNRVGQVAEHKVKTKLLSWLKKKMLIEKEIGENEFLLKSDITLKFASEPDIGFYRGTFLKNEKLIAIVEIKGGKDPAGALERIGALEKTMNEVPSECWRFAILGVTTKQMNERLEKLPLSDRFDLERLLVNENGEWDKFTSRVFKEALRIKYV